MANLIDYLQWRGDLDPAAVPLGPVDYAVLAALAYVPFEQVGTMDLCGKTLGQLSTEYADVMVMASKSEAKKSVMEMWRMLPWYPRFANMTLQRFNYQLEDNEIDELDKQFAAAAFGVAGADGADMTVVAFRGTDSTLVGWREDFTMSYAPTVPSLTEAVEFLVSTPLPAGGLYTCGHSKGGYLAVASAAKVACGKPISGVWNFDGPGLKDDELTGPGWAAIVDVAHMIVPESSVFGRIFGHGVERRVVASDGASIGQHNMFQWHVLGADFVAGEGLTSSSDVMARVFDELSTDLSEEERKTGIDAIFKVLTATGAETTSDVTGHLLKNLPVMLKSAQYSDGEKAALKRIFGAVAKNAVSDIDLKASLAGVWANIKDAVGDMMEGDAEAEAEASAGVAAEVAAAPEDDGSVTSADGSLTLTL